MKKFMQVLKKPTVIETIRLNGLCWFGHVQRMEENIIPKSVLYINLGITRLRDRLRNRWQDEVRERMDEQLGEKGRRRNYITERNGRRS